jgi:hypothetical protein
VFVVLSLELVSFGSDHRALRFTLAEAAAAPVGG